MMILLLPVLLPLLAGTGVILLPLRNRRARTCWIMTAVSFTSAVIAGIIAWAPSDTLTLVTLTSEITIAFL